MGDDSLLFDEDARNDREDILEVNELNAIDEPYHSPKETNLSPTETDLSPAPAPAPLSAMNPSLFPGGSLRDHCGENHSLKSARASSLPGNKGEASQDETNLSPNKTNLPPNFTLITDGSQFRMPFWEAECQSLQDRIRRQLNGQRMRDIPSRRIPTADELQIQFVTWLLTQPHLPLLISPASSGFYSAVWGDTPAPSAGTGFFDEEYVSGKFQGPVHSSRITHDSLNPSTRPELTYQEACTAELTTISAVELHEQRLFQPGYTPTAIRDNILVMLRTSKPDQHMVNFQ